MKGISRDVVIGKHAIDRIIQYYPIMGGIYIENCAVRDAEGFLGVVYSDTISSPPPTVNREVCYDVGVIPRPGAGNIAAVIGPIAVPRDVQGPDCCARARLELQAAPVGHRISGLKRCIVGSECREGQRHPDQEYCSQEDYKVHSDSRSSQGFTYVQLIV
jgi:hypothetical protein